MKNLVIILIAILIVTSQCLEIKKNKTNIEQLFIVSYNVENLFDTLNDPYNPSDDEYLPTGKKKWTQKKYEKKLFNLAKVLSSISKTELPDLIGICEVENKKVLEDLILQETLKNANYGIVHENSSDKRGIDVALLYKKEEFNYLSHKNIKVYNGTREILYVKGIVSKSDTLHIFVNHWKSRYPTPKETEHKRIKFAIILRKQVDSILDLNINANIIMLGDFNDEPQNISLENILRATNNRTSKNSYELFNTMYEKDLANKGSYSYNYEWLMLDEIIISQNLLNNNNGFKLDKNTGQIFDRKWILYYNSNKGKYKPQNTYYGGYSDHLPVYLIFEKEN